MTDWPTPRGRINFAYSDPCNGRFVNPKLLHHEVNISLERNDMLLEHQHNETSAARVSYGVHPIREPPHHVVITLIMYVDDFALIKKIIMINNNIIAILSLFIKE